MNEWLRGRTQVDPAGWEELRARTGTSESYLRRLLREADIPMHPLVEGVRQENFDQLERTLLAMSDTPEGRRLVLLAKQHARLTLRSPNTNRAEKEEMILWMTVWLETPALFARWVELRKRATTKGA